MVFVAPILISKETVQLTQATQAANQSAQTTQVEDPNQIVYLDASET